MQTKWYEQFFYGLALEFWRNAVSAEQTTADADFIESELRLPPGHVSWISHAGTAAIRSN